MNKEETKNYRIIRLRRDILYQDEMTREEAEEQVKLYSRREENKDDLIAYEEIKEDD